MAKFLKSFALATCVTAICSSSGSAFAQNGKAKLVDRFDSGPIPITISTAGLPVVSVRLNSYATTAILDTGSSTVLVDSRVANDHSLLTTRQGVSGAIGGQVLTGVIPDLGVVLGSVSLQQVPARVADLSRVAASTNLNASVILGMSALGTHNMDLDFRRMQLRLHSGPPTGVVGLKSYPLSQIEGIPVISLPVNGRILRIAIDTGKDSEFEATNTTFDMLRSPANPETTIASAGLGGISIAKLTSSPSLQFGTVTLRDIRLEGEQSSGLTGRLGVDAIAGAKLVRKLNIYFDFEKALAYISPSGAVVSPSPKSTSGLQLAYGETIAQVAYVMANSPAAQNGWKAGDQVCQIDGHTIQEVRSSPMLKAWGTGKPGHTIVLSMCSGIKRQLTLKSFY